MGDMGEHVPCDLEGEGGERKRKKVRECEFSFRSEVRKKNVAHTGPGARWATHL